MPPAVRFAVPVRAAHEALTVELDHQLTRRLALAFRLALLLAFTHNTDVTPPDTPMLFLEPRISSISCFISPWVSSLSLSSRRGVR